MANSFNKYDLHPRIIERLPELGFKKPTTVQQKVLPMLLQGKNLVVEAATGTGKTAAYGLPIISRLNYRKRSIQALILTPSRDLARQVEKDLNSYSTIENLKIEAIYGGTNLKTSINKVNSAPHILVAVPGRLRDVLDDDRFPYFWRDINFIIIDEVDKLLESGFQHELDTLLSNAKKKAQVAVFSATINEEVEYLVRERWPKLRSVRLSHQEALKNIRFFSVMVDKGQDEITLLNMIESKKLKTALIFCRKRDAVYSVVNFLRSNGKVAEEYHGMMDQVERKAVMDRFRSGAVNYLVATDLAARGLDIEDLPAVVNFHLPDDIEVYLHRVGRTGRAGNKGVCYNLVTSNKEQIILHALHAELAIAYKEISIQNRNTGSKSKAEKLVKAHLSRGKKDKVRKGDVVGFLLNTIDMDAEDIGTIAVYDNHTIVSLPAKVLKTLTNEEDLKMKGKSVKVRKYGVDEQKARARSVKKLVQSSQDRNARKRRKSGGK